MKIEKIDGEFVLALGEWEELREKGFVFEAVGGTLMRVDLSTATVTATKSKKEQKEELRKQKKEIEDKLNELGE